jgi:hypothetical protein
MQTKTMQLLHTAWHLRWCCLLVLLCSCCTTPLAPVTPKPDTVAAIIPPDILHPEPYPPEGGDIRGVYYPNRPFFKLGYLASSFLDLAEGTTNGGTGRLIISGSESRGTFRTENLRIQFDGYLSEGFGDRLWFPVADFAPDSMNTFFNLGGNWAMHPTDASHVVFYNRTKVEDIYYTADSVGLYIYSRIPYGFGRGVVYGISTFKKQR